MDIHQLIPHSDIVFHTVHGSHLYGLNHEESDHDIFVVTDTYNRTSKVRHFFAEDGTDVAVVDVFRFIELAQSGSHQSAEALFSPMKHTARRGSIWMPYLHQLTITGGDVFAKYERTIRRFAYGDTKRRRHAVRLTLNLQQLRIHGRMNPALSPEQVRYCVDTAEAAGENLLVHLGVPLSS